jgi:hypothetical protein
MGSRSNCTVNIPAIIIFNQRRCKTSQGLLILKSLLFPFSIQLVPHIDMLNLKVKESLSYSRRPKGLQKEKLFWEPMR